MFARLVQVLASEAANRALQEQLQESTQRLAQTTAEYDAQVCRQVRGKVSAVDQGQATVSSMSHTSSGSVSVSSLLGPDCSHTSQPCSPCVIIQVQQLKSQLSEACSFNTQLTALVEQKGGKLDLLKEHFGQIKNKYQVRELGGGTGQGRAPLRGAVNAACCGCKGGL